MSDVKVALAEALAEEMMKRRRMEAALRKIARWFGEFPASGKVFKDGTPMSYGAAYGSNGERDYMRQVALNALDDALGDQS
jgi:hypothetical protein